MTDASLPDRRHIIASAMHNGHNTHIDGPLEISVDGDASRVVIALRGELDLATAPAFEAELTAALERGGPVEVDLRELEFIDSTGIRILLAANKRVGQNNGAFTLRSGSPQVQRIFEVTGLFDTLTFVDGNGRPD